MQTLAGPFETDRLLAFRGHAEPVDLLVFGRAKSSGDFKKRSDTQCPAPAVGVVAPSPLLIVTSRFLREAAARIPILKHEYARPYLIRPSRHRRSRLPVYE
jgi:hypothetical protein